MKAGIITYHFPYNSGAALQSLALQTVLSSMGHEVSILNYRPWYHQNICTPNKNVVYIMQESMEQEKAAGTDLLHRMVHAGRAGSAAAKFNMSGSDSFKISEQKFGSFVKRFHHETQVCRTFEDLKKIAGDYDVLFSGSDQLWNTNLTKGQFDPAYFLTFAEPHTKCVTYAMGVNFRDDVVTNRQLAELIRGLDCISLREEKFIRTIRRAMPSAKIRQDIDPTLLLQKEDYAPFEAEPNEFMGQPYIMTYTMGDGSQKYVYAAAKQLSEKLGIPVRDITGNPLRKEKVFGVECVKGGPDEFLSYIKNAAYIVTNSFHGTAFSLIYGKQFVTVPHLTTGNRVTDLLKRVGLQGRICRSEEECLERIEVPVDHTEARERLAVLREASMDYLRDVMSGKKETSTED